MSGQNVHEVGGGAAARALLFSMSLLFGSSAGAFQILPRVSDVDESLTKYSSRGLISKLGQWGVSYAIPMIKSPVHEAITLRALGCPSDPGDELSCVTKENIERFRAILYGVRWPDDPPFSLSRTSPPRIRACDPKVTLRSTSQPECWRALFRDAGRRSTEHGSVGPAFGPGHYLLYRTHYGDLQFLHAMATHKGEPTVQTAREMKVWAKYLWGVATRRLDTTVYLRDLGVDDLGQHFPGDQTTVNLLSTGLPQVRDNLHEVAIGALLHMVQDSFSAAHTVRADATGGRCPRFPSALAPGRISQFQSYAGQDADWHDDQDTKEALSLHALQELPTVIDVSQTFVSLWREQAEWDRVELYFDCVFAVTAATREVANQPQTVDGEGAQVALLQAPR